LDASPPPPPPYVRHVKTADSAAAAPKAAGSAAGSDTATFALYAAMVGVLIYGYNYAKQKNMLPEVLGGKKQHKIPSLPTNMPPPRARPKKVDVVVDRGDNDGEQLKVEVQTPKTMQSVMEFGESLADEMATQLEIEEPFKLYYVDPEGDSMLVSAHTSLRDLIYSDCITAKLDDPEEGEEDEDEEDDEEGDRVRMVQSMVEKIDGKRDSGRKSRK